MNIFGLHPVVVFGVAPSQRERWLPPLITGGEKACFGVTEPDAGLNTLNIKTRADRRGDPYVANGLLGTGSHAVVPMQLPVT